MRRVLLLLVIACLAAPLALYCYSRGVAPYGNSYPGDSSQPCLLPQALPSGTTVADRDPSDDAAKIRYTTIPLGFVCSVELTNPPRTETFTHQSWPATIAWLGLSIVAALAAMLAFLLGLFVMLKSRRAKALQN